MAIITQIPYCEPPRARRLHGQGGAIEFYTDSEGRMNMTAREE